MISVANKKIGFIFLSILLSVIIIGISNTHAQEPSFDCLTITEDMSQSECEALIAIYNATNGINWNYENGLVPGSPWMQTTTPCSWLGVTCNAANQITDLNLSSSCCNESDEFGLAGAMPAKLGNLTHLTTLSLAYNQLTTMPAEIGNLSNLTELRLFGNKIATLPTELWGMTNLTFLSVGSEQLVIMPPDIGKLTNLTDLYWSDSPLMSLPAEIGNLSNLKLLLLQNNQLTELPPEISNLTTLTHLYLYENQLVNLPMGLGNMPNLEHLLLHDNPNLQGELPLGLINSSPVLFYFDDTQLCEPADTTFQTWLETIEYLNRSQIMCDDNHYSYLPILPRVAIAGNEANPSPPPTVSSISNMTVIDRCACPFLTPNACPPESAGVMVEVDFQYVGPLVDELYIQGQLVDMPTNYIPGIADGTTDNYVEFTSFKGKAHVYMFPSWSPTLPEEVTTTQIELSFYALYADETYATIDPVAQFNHTQTWSRNACSP